MKRILIAAVIVLAGCSKPEEKPAAPAVQYFKVDPAQAGEVKGSVLFTGKKPAPAKRITMEADEDCQKLHKEPVLDEALLIGANKGLANVFVYVKTGLEGKNFEPPAETVVLEQKGCQFLPRVVALRAGQNFAVKNSDPVSHNVHPMPRNNRDWNQQQPPGAPDLKRKFTTPEVMIPVKCNIHNWMRSYIAVLDHSYFAVTSKDGEFSLKNLPAGEYTLAAWHEQFGEKTMKVTVAAGGAAATASFEMQ